MTRLPMTTVRAGVAMALVLGATLAGLIGTGLIYTALTAHVWGALMWGLPLALGGLYWCGRALAQGQRSLRQRRVNRTRDAAGASLHHTRPDSPTASLRLRGTTDGRVH